jgi:peptidoglycan hydrolase-like protein with peptidoglycan-binding domain
MVAPVAAVPPASVAAGFTTYEVTPGYLPPGYVYLNVEDVDVPTLTGATVRLHTTRYVNRDVPGRADVLYFSVAHGGELVLDPDQSTVVRTIGDLSGLYTNTGAVREFSYLPSTGTSGDIVSIGALGSVPETELTHVILETVLTVVDAAPDLGLRNDPGGGSGGCTSQCPAATNMKGTNKYTDDWSGDGPNRTIRDGSRGNDVALWQAVLWAECLDRGGQYPCYSACHVDGVFGAETKQYTWNFQADYIVYDHNGDWSYADGIVGPTTWSYADDHILATSRGLVYQGSSHTVALVRQKATPYDYNWRWATSDLRYTGYTGIDVKRPAGC